MPSKKGRKCTQNGGAKKKWESELVKESSVRNEKEGVIGVERTVLVQTGGQHGRRKDDDKKRISPFERGWIDAAHPPPFFLLY